MKIKSLTTSIFSLLLICTMGQAQQKYPGSIASTDPDEVSIRLPDHVMPVMGCWFWHKEQLDPDGYMQFLDRASVHSPYNLLTTTFRIPEKEITEDDFHRQIKLAAQYAIKKGIPLVVDLDVRLARRAFQARYPDELQEMLILHELELSNKGAVESVIHSQDLGDHYTFRTTHYIPLDGSMLRVYAYDKTPEGIDEQSLEDITEKCTLVSCNKDSVQVRIPGDNKSKHSHACVMASFTHLTPDVFAPHLISFQRELIHLYADAPLAGVCKDEWGFPPSYDGNPEKNQFWYSLHRAKAYSERTRGRDLLFDCLLMHLGIRGKEDERQAAINHFMEMSWQRNSELEDDFYHAVKKEFGPTAVVATHPTWWPYPDLHEYKKNGLDWWASTRDWAQTDEHTPYPVRTALAKKWGSPIWYNMYYADNKQDYETSIWSHALAGGRINYHRIYPSRENTSGEAERLELLRGDLMQAESRIRLLNYISKSAIDCPVAVVFGHACTMNWAGATYDDVGMDLANSLWSAGIMTDLIPSSEIENGNLKIDKTGWITYGEQRYAALVLYHPEFSRKSVSDFFQKASQGKTDLFRMGDWTKDFNGQAIGSESALPESMVVSSDIPTILKDIHQSLNNNNIPPQTPATGSLEYSTHVMSAPPTTGFCRLNDGTVIQLAGTENVKGDPIQSEILIADHRVSFDATGVAAVRLDSDGQVLALAAGGLKAFKSGKMEWVLEEPIDLAFWINDSGEYEGVLQNWPGKIPPQLLEITGNWARLGVPVPYSVPLTIENEHYRISVDKCNGAITSLYIKANQSELIQEEKLASNFRICLPLEDYQANYIDGMDQKAAEVKSDGQSISVTFNGLQSARGKFKIDLSYTISLVEDYVSFTSQLTNHEAEAISEFWFPRIGGWKQFGSHRNAMLATPNYNTNSKHNISLFRNYPGGRGLGAEAAEWSIDYPGMVMPWWDIYDAETDQGLYMAYHDPVFRLSTWHTYLMPNHSGSGRDAWLSAKEAAGEAVGLVFSHVRYPFIHSGESLESGEFIIRAHPGDWHTGSLFYRNWFMAHFPFDKSESWLRKESSWFTSIIYQPEDKIIADYKTYDSWTKDAQKYGINCFELIGWDKGGLERDYPVYQPEEKLGGREGFRKLLKSIDESGGKCLVFNNYNILDQNTSWYKDELFKYKQQDGFGQQNIWMGWGESTLMARKQLNVRHHVRSSVTPVIEKILSDQFLDLVRDGAHGFQIDKVCVGGALDFNPLNTLKPDVALFEGLVQAINRLNMQCLAINPDFRMASEFGYDRLLPYFDVGYRNAGGLDISTFRYVFPEWTSCNHISLPRDFRSANGAVLTGSVICLEPDSYQGSIDQPLYKDLIKYIQELERIRKELLDIIFLGKYYDDQFASILEVSEEASKEDENKHTNGLAIPGQMPGIGENAARTLRPSRVLHYKVHGHKDTDQRAIVVVNDSPDPVQYVWGFEDKTIVEALLYEPFEETKTVRQGDEIEIKGDGLHIIVEKNK